MRYSLLFVISTALIFQACDKGDEITSLKFNCLEGENGTDQTIWTNDCIDNWTCDYTIFVNSAVDTMEYNAIGSGSDLVFQLRYDLTSNPLVPDDDFTGFVTFEIKSDEESFSFDSESLSDNQVYYHYICFCFPYVGYIQPTLGCLQGEKQEDNSWLVQGNLFFGEDIDGDEIYVLFDAVFE